MRRATSSKSSTSGLANLRQTIGLTQTELADLIGVKRATIENIEGGRSKAALVALTAKLMAATGVDPGSLHEGQPRSLNGRNYTSETYKSWKEITFDEGHLKTTRDLLLAQIDLLLECAVKPSQETAGPQLFCAVAASLSEWIDNALKMSARQVGDTLEWRINAAYQKRATKKRAEETTVGVLRKMFSKAPVWKKHDTIEKHWSDSTPATLSTESTTRYCPVVGPIKHNGRLAFAYDTTLTRLSHSIRVGSCAFTVVVDRLGATAIEGTRAVLPPSANSGSATKRSKKTSKNK